MAKDLTIDGLAESILNLVRRVEALLQRQAADPQQRVLVALAGVPGSGKSTVSHALLTELASRGIDDVAVVPMDGFHYTKQVLSTFEDPELAFQRRGAPFTFNAGAFLKLVKTLKHTPVTSSDAPPHSINVPTFDHAVQDPVENGLSLPSTNRLVIIEGNYTLLNQTPWSGVAKACDEKWFVDIPAHTARDRLAQRHLAAGIETSRPDAIRRAETNDLPNGELIRSLLIQPDIIIEN